MKRFHVHVAVDDLAAATRFYATLFGAEPSVAKPDYAKWMLDDPRVNFAISARGRAAGLEHLGIQVDSGDELAALHERLEAAGETLADKGAATCCYAESDKGWVTDPAGLSWETFWTYGAATTYGSRQPRSESSDAASGCCAPTAAAGSCGTSARTSGTGTAAVMPERACCHPMIG
jgi:catechol 2,3-dioxygenase-like lactoylglutathione lyase family enzyme